MLSDPLEGEAFRNTDKAVPPSNPKALHVNIWDNQEPATDGGFDEALTTDSTLLSSWPPEDYMILAVEQKQRAIPTSLLPRITLGSPMVNTLGLTRADLYVADQMDHMNSLLPNPYPFNLVLGNDVTRVAAVLGDLKKTRKATSRAKSSLGFYSKHEEAQHVCYGSTPFDWKQCNSSKDVIGLDNSLPESWLVNPLMQAMYHAHPPHYPVRRAIMRHVCKKSLCVSCEISILFTNMATQSMATPIVQPHNLIRAMKSHPKLAEFFLTAKGPQRRRREDAPVADCAAVGYGRGPHGAEGGSVRVRLPVG